MSFKKRGFNMENKKIGTKLLTGLITGSMLGSGIIILPPLAYKALGNYAIFTWLIIVIFGALFAKVFTNLSIQFPGDGGVSNAVEAAFGQEFKKLTSYFLIFAVFTGPTAVMITAGEHLSNIYKFSHSTNIYALIFILICSCILLSNIKSISKVSLVLSVAIALILLVGAITVLLGYTKDYIPQTLPSINEFGKTILILFWAIVGWEVIGNYSNEVKDIKKTINRAVIFSFLIVNIVYFLVSLAMQSIDVSVLANTYNLDTNNISIILIPAYGKYAIPLMSFTTIALCISTYILFVGSVARLINSLSAEGNLPKLLAKKSSNNSPYTAIIFLSSIHIFSLILAMVGILNIEKIVSFANVFFICNALLGILASMKLYKTKSNFIITFILVVMLLLLLVFSAKLVLIVPLVLSGWSFYKRANSNKKLCEEN